MCVFPKVHSTIHDNNANILDTLFVCMISQTHRPLHITTQNIIILRQMAMGILQFITLFLSNITFPNKQNFFRRQTMLL